MHSRARWHAATSAWGERFTYTFRLTAYAHSEKSTRKLYRERWELTPCAGSQSELTIRNVFWCVGPHQTAMGVPRLRGADLEQRGLGSPMINATPFGETWAQQTSYPSRSCWPISLRAYIGRRLPGTRREPTAHHRLGLSLLVSSFSYHPMLPRRGSWRRRSNPPPRPKPVIR